MELSRLPDSLLLEIFQYISYENLCLGIRLTNRKFYNLSHDCSLWKLVEIPHHFTNERFIMWIKQVHAHVEGIDCSQCENLTVKAFEELGDLDMPRLKHLAVPISCSFPDHVFMKFVQRCPNLEELENVVANEEETCHPIICQSLFKKLTVVHDKPVSTYGRLRKIILRPSVADDNKNKRAMWRANLETLSERCPEVKSYHSRRGLDYVNDETITDVAKMFPKLEELELHYCEVGDAGLISFFAHHTGTLLYLALDKADGITDKGIETISGSLKNLQRLKIARCPNISNAGVQNLVSSCDNLRDVHLNNNMKKVDYTDETVIHLAKSCPNLTTLSIFNSASVTGKSLSVVQQKCKSLAGILLYQCPNIGDDALEILSKMTYLRSLVLMHCDEITPTGVIDLLLKAGRLHRLTLFNKTRKFYGDMSQLGEGVISFFHTPGTKYLPNVVKILNVSGVGGPFAQLLTALCPNVHTIDLRDEIPLTVTSMNNILKTCENLKVLDATNLPKLDDTFVSAVCLYGKNLRKIALGDAVHQIAPDGLCKIISECASLKTLCLDLKVYKIDEEKLIKVAKETHGGHCFVQEDTSSLVLEGDQPGDNGRYIEIFMTPKKYLNSVHSTLTSGT